MIIIEANGALDMLLIYNSLVCIGRGHMARSPRGLGLDSAAERRI